MIGTDGIATPYSPSKLLLHACCFGPSGYLQKWKEQKCAGGVWVDNGKTKCSGNCLR
jgi:hypothetical protein